MSDLVLQTSDSPGVVLEVDGSSIAFTLQPIGLSLGIAIGPATGEANTSLNDGAGAEVFKEKSGLALVFRTLTGSDGITVAEGADEIDISAVAALLSKSGIVIAGGFAGNPRKAAVTFATPFASANYSVTFDPVTTGGGRYSLVAESKAASGFVINLGSGNIIGLDHVGWQAVLAGEA